MLTAPWTRLGWLALGGTARHGELFRARSSEVNAALAAGSDPVI
jgi:hypothetical protein